MQRTVRWLDIAQDVRVSLRGLLRAPVLTLTILLTVGLGIGATTAIFSAAEAAFLRPLPYADPERLVWIYLDSPPFKFRFSVADYLALESQQSQFARIAGFTNRSMTFSDGMSAQLLQGRAVSWTYFGTLGLVPALGRDFDQADGAAGAPPVVIVTHAVWQQRLGGRPDAIGKPLKLDGADYLLVGVLPRLVGPLEQRQEFFIAAQFRPPTRRGPFSYWMLGRLRPGVSHAAATDELRAINRRIFPIWKASYQDERATWSLVDLKARLVEGRQTTAALALAAVGLVWLIACVNASNLLMARVTGRERELAVRSALGASRARLTRLLLIESSLLAAGSALVGAGVAWLGMGLLGSHGSTYLPRTQEISVNGPVLGVFGAAVCLGIAIFGAIPAMHATGGRVDEGLRGGGRTSTGSRSARRLRHLLVGSQFAISTPLLVMATLLLVSLDALKGVDLGFDARGIVTGSVRLPAALYQDNGRVTNYWDELSRRLAGVPGVSSVAFADSLPPNGASNINNFDLEESPTPAGQSQPATPWVAVTPDYFRTMSITLLEGRLLDDRDARTEALEAVLVDRAWAARFFPGRSAVGKRFKQGGCSQCPWTAVVGVVSDVRYAGLGAANEGTVYTPLPGGLARSVIVRTDGDPRAVMGSIRQAVHDVDPTVPLTEIATVEDLVARALESPASLSLLVASVAAVALVLAVLGIYGVMAYQVQQRAREIGIRRALGGSSGHVLRLVTRQGMTVVLAGIAVGLPIAYLSSRSLSSLLFSVSAGDMTTYAAVTVFLTLVALAACVIPARRVLAMPPSAVLRSE